MTAKLTTVVGQLNIVGGAWRSDAPNQVAVREPKSADKPGAGKGDLFVLVEVHSQTKDRHTIERQLAETIRDAYYLAPGSTTAGLRRAIQAAGDLLYDHNAIVGREERVVGGAVALVVKDKDAFVAQIGPAACFAVLGNFVRRYPAQSAWLDEAFTPHQDAAEAALGFRTVVEPHLHHLRINPSDVLVLADSGLAGQLPPGVVAKTVGADSIKAAVKNLGNVAQSKDCSALVLGVVEQQPKLVPAPLKNVSPPKLGRFFHHAGHQPEEPDAAAQPEPVATQTAAPARTPFPWLPGRAKQAPAPHAAVEPRRGVKQAAIKTGAVPPKRRPTRTLHTGLAEFDLEPEEEPVLASTAPEPALTAGLGYRPRSEPNTGGKPMGSWLGKGILVIIALLGHALKSIFSLAAPSASRPGGHRQAGLQAQRPPSRPLVSWAMLRNLAIAIPLVVAAIVGVSYLQKDRMREAEYQELISSAQTKFEQAQAVDRPSALGLIGEARSLLTQAEQIKPDQPEIAELRNQMADAADKLANVQRLYYLPQLRQYTDPGTNLKSLIVQGVEIYVLDSGNGRVFHHRLDDLGEALLPDDDSLLLVSRGQAVEGATVGQLLGMAWVPAGGNRQTSDLVILSSSGLFEYHPTWGLGATTIAGAESMVYPAAVSSFFGNFYVLDPQANALFRYLPTGNGYDAPPESYFPADHPVDLSAAVDFAIDGAVYVLFSDGRIGKYLSGEPVDFNITGLDVPFNNPVSIFTAPSEEVQYVYVADAGNQRVVQLNKDGSFVRQFKPRPGEAVSFANLQDIYVDELGGRLYLLDSNNLYVANMPAE